MADVSPHEWLRPKVIGLLEDAEAAGIARDVSVAVITDLVNGVLPAAGLAPAEENPDQDIGEPDYMVHENLGHVTPPDEAGGGRELGRLTPHLGRRRR